MASQCWCSLVVTKAQQLRRMKATMHMPGMCTSTQTAGHTCLQAAAAVMLTIQARVRSAAAYYNPGKVNRVRNSCTRYLPSRKQSWAPQAATY